MSYVPYVEVDIRYFIYWRKSYDREHSAEDSRRWVQQHLQQRIGVYHQQLRPSGARPQLLVDHRLSSRVTCPGQKDRTRVGKAIYTHLIVERYLAKVQRPDCSHLGRQAQSLGINDLPAILQRVHQICQVPDRPRSAIVYLHQHHRV